MGGARPQIRSYLLFRGRNSGALCFEVACKELVKKKKGKNRIQGEAAMVVVNVNYVKNGLT